MFLTDMSSTDNANTGIRIMSVEDFGNGLELGVIERIRGGVNVDAQCTRSSLVTGIEGGGRVCGIGNE